MEQLWMGTLSLLWFVLDLWFLHDDLKAYYGKACKLIVSFPQSELPSFLKSLSQTLGILSVAEQPGLIFLGELWTLDPVRVQL